MTEPMTITFWGARGSYPATGPRTLRRGGNTPCVEVNAGGQTIILDAGTGIIALGHALVARAASQQSPIDATLLFSHYHHDHTQGFPFFNPLHEPTATLRLLGPTLGDHDLATTLTHVMSPPMFPLCLVSTAADKSIYALRESDTILLGDNVYGMEIARFGRAGQPNDSLVRVRTLRSHAHPGGTFIYRIEWGGRAVVYATDSEGDAHSNSRLVDFARGADMLIHDAQYTEEHYRYGRPPEPAAQGRGHSTPQMACTVARAAQVGQLVLFHHDPTYEDSTLTQMETDARTLFAPTQLAAEGLCLTLTAQPAPCPRQPQHTSLAA